MVYISASSLLAVYGPDGGSGAAAPECAASDFEAKVKGDQILSGVLDGEISLNYAKYPQETAAVYAQLKALGYQGNSDTDNVAQFQRLIGIPAKEASGQVIGQKTLAALVVASRCKDWKKAVVSHAFPPAPILESAKADAKKLLKSLDSSVNRKYIYDTADGSQSATRGRSYNLKYSDGTSLFVKDVNAAYTLLGLMPDGDLIQANYRFQVLSGSNSDPAKKALIGPGTYDALKAALQKVAAGQDWRK
ncbi:MAG: hypothetical protein NT099_07515 [Candidatus Saganbacteria bacterium]|nr:hypothetical protein [Candidatus Saganbacteria bacterium]